MSKGKFSNKPKKEKGMKKGKGNQGKGWKKGKSKDWTSSKAMKNGKGKRPSSGSRRGSLKRTKANPKIIYLFGEW